MVQAREIVITGIGVVSPIGIGSEAFWSALAEGRSGVRQLDLFNGSDMPPAIGGAITGFEPMDYVRPRKSLKVMSRDIQLAFAAADLACQQARLRESAVDPDRLGIVFGADMIPCELSELVNAFRGCMEGGRFDFGKWGDQCIAEMFPLWMLKYLPNMPACHIGIAQDARGPNNSLTQGETSSLAAVAECVRVIQRGQADVMIAGGTSSRIHPQIWAYHRAFQMSARRDDPAAASRPFDADRDGMVYGEGSGVIVLEDRRHAEARGATVLARLLAFADVFEPRPHDRPLRGEGIRESIRQVLRQAHLRPNQIGYTSAHGLSTTAEDRMEAQAIHDTLGDVPVTALKSFFGNLGAGGGAVEMAANVLAFQHSLIPFTLNYQTPDPQCPINVVSRVPRAPAAPTAIVLSQSRVGQAIALLLAAP